MMMIMNATLKRKNVLKKLKNAKKDNIKMKMENVKNAQNTAKDVKIKTIVSSVIQAHT